MITRKLTLSALDWCSFEYLEPRLLLSAYTLGQDVVLYWHQVAVAASLKQGGPTDASRAETIIFAAIADAYAGVTGELSTCVVKKKAPSGSDVTAAVSQAAHDTLAALFSNQKKTFDADLKSVLDAVPNGKGENQGVQYGKFVASQVIQASRRDNFNNITYTSSGFPGTNNVNPLNTTQGVLTPDLTASNTQVVPSSMISTFTLYDNMNVGGTSYLTGLPNVAPLALVGDIYPGGTGSYVATQADLSPSKYNAPGETDPTKYPAEAYSPSNKVLTEADLVNLVTAALARAPGAKIVCLDFEHSSWATCKLASFGDVPWWTQRYYPSALAALSQACDWIHKDFPGLKVGVWNAFPSQMEVYWSAWYREHYLNDPTGVNQMNAAMQFAKPLLSHSDVVFPSFYPHYLSTADEVGAMNMVLDSIASLTKLPVIPYITARYWFTPRDSSMNSLPGYTDDANRAFEPEDASKWAAILNLVRNRCGAAVLWDNIPATHAAVPGFDLSAVQWVPDAPWVLTLEQFLTGAAPAAPVIARINPDTGSNAADAITNDSTLVLSGTAEANSVVTLARQDIGVIGTCTASGTGAWSFDYTRTVLPDGTYTFTATAANIVGNASGDSAPFVVTVDTTPPTVKSTLINNGQLQRSLIEVVTAQFSEAISPAAAASALHLHNNTTNQDVDLSLVAYSYDAATHSATWDLTAVTLSDGKYTATLVAAAILDPAGNVLQGGNYSFSFFRLEGDADGDGTVGGTDYAIWLSNFGTHGVTPGLPGDFDGDGTVGGNDYAIWLKNFGRSIV